MQNKNNKDIIVGARVVSDLQINDCTLKPLSPYYMIDYKHIALISKLHRKENKISQKELADIAGVSERSIATIETAQKTRIETIGKILEVCGYNLEVKVIKK